MENQLVVLPSEVAEIAKNVSVEKRNEVQTVLNHVFNGVAKMREQLDSVTVTDAHDKVNMKLANTIRLGVRQERLEAEKTFDAKRADVQQQMLSYKTEDSLWLKAKQTMQILTKEIEENARWKEETKERFEAEQKELKVQQRILKVAKVTPEMARTEFESMSDETFEMFFAGIEKAFNDKIEDEKKAEAERIEKEKAEIAERERIRKENEQLKAEAEAKEKQLIAERAKAEAERKAIEEAAKKEREENERKLKAEQEAARIAAEKAADEKAKLEAEIKAKAEAEEKERKEAEAKVISEQIAKTCHEVNKAFCESIGDLSQPSWENAPQWQKESAVNGVNFHLSNPNSKPCDSHNNWMDEKLKDGWKFGEVKNPETKEHPCMVYYEQLPKDQQTKDALFISVVRSFE